MPVSNPLIADRTCDVLIVGAGLAGGCLARHLKLEMPELDIVIIDQKESFDWGLGESTVESFDIYSDRFLKLGHYLEKWYIEKHGLRFFYDSPEKNYSMSEMSEFGRDARHPVRASQLDRKQIDTDLCDLNRKLGIEVLMGTRAFGRVGDPADLHLRVDAENGHLLRTSRGTFKCKWLVEAGGQTPPIARALGRIVKDERHLAKAYWGRWEGCNIIDHLGDEDWRRRVNYTQRFQSTNHFMYRGYWIWYIPLTENLWSIGVSLDPNKLPIKFKNGDELDAFLRTHKALGDLMGPNSKRLDFMALSHCAQYSPERFTTDRVYMAGMASGVVDALNSNTSRMWPEINAFIVELIRSDKAGDKALHASQIKHFNLRAQEVYEGVLESFRHYDFWGSFDTHMPFCTGVISGYWNTTIPDYFSKFEKIMDTAATHGADCSCKPGQTGSLSASTLGAYSRIGYEFLAFLDRTGKYHANNHKQFQNARFCELRPGVWEKSYSRRNSEAEAANDVGTYEWIFKYYATRMAALDGKELDERVFADVFERSVQSKQSLGDVVARAARTQVAVPR